LRGLQCISSDKLTGSSEVTNAHCATATTTASNISEVQHV
jgi:hypothetical protein